MKSTGIEAHGLNPNVVKAMAEVVVNISTQQSELIDEQLLHSATLIVTLCGDAADNCRVTILSYASTGAS